MDSTHNTIQPITVCNKRQVQTLLKVTLQITTNLKASVCYSYPDELKMQRQLLSEGLFFHMYPSSPTVDHHLLIGSPNINPYPSLSSLAYSLRQKYIISFTPSSVNFRLPGNYTLEFQAPKHAIESSTHQSMPVILLLSVFTRINPMFQANSTPQHFLNTAKTFPFVHLCSCLFSYQKPLSFMHPISLTDIPPPP